jgi:mono/diheme cytochrome c family protein
MRYYVPCSFRKARFAGLAAIVALTAGIGLARPAIAQDDQVAEGQRIWSRKAECPQCHGWAGDGNGGLHSAGLAASLRTTKLTREQIRVTIQCGRPGTPMPHFDRFAYTDKRCYDMTAKDLGDTVPDRAAVTLQSYEIDDLATYIAAKIKGAGPITRGECLKFFGANAGDHCDRYPAGDEAAAAK